MADIKIALRQEAADLEAQLQADPRYAKLAQIRALLALYGEESTTPTKATFAPVPAKPRQQRGDADRIRALEIADALLEGRTEPTKTSDILEAIEAEGIAIGGNSPVSNLSAMLSRSGKFFAHGRTGWTRKVIGTPYDPAVLSKSRSDDWDQEEEPPPETEVTSARVGESWDEYRQRTEDAYEKLR